MGVLGGAATDAIHLVDDGRTMFGVDLAFHHRQVLLVLAGGRYAGLLPATSEVDDGAPILARANFGRWIADCPDCRGATMVWVEQPLQWCPDCHNRAVGHRWRRVALPPAEERVAIEGALARRPGRANRNWEPGETVADLLAENAAMLGGRG